VVRDQSLNKLDIYRADVSYRKIAVENDSAFVKTIAQLEDMRTPVYYSMRKKSEEWVVTDMIIDEVSTVASYRRSFQNIIRKKGFDHLLAVLRKRVAD
jgi:phospholipid transport system substrate-binding protein